MGGRSGSLRIGICLYCAHAHLAGAITLTACSARGPMPAELPAIHTPARAPASTSTSSLLAAAPHVIVSRLALPSHHPLLSAAAARRLIVVSPAKPPVGKHRGSTLHRDKLILA